jgi:hypothetical protein
MCSTDELRMRGLDGTTQKNPPSSFRLLEAAASGNRISSICLLSLSLVCVWVLDGRPLTPGQRTAASLVVCSISFYFFFSISLRLLAQLFDLSRLICDVCCAEHCVDMYMYPSFAMELTENKRQYRSWRRKGGLKGVSTILISYNLCFLFFNGDLQLGLAQQITC